MSVLRALLLRVLTEDSLGGGMPRRRSIAKLDSDLLNRLVDYAEGGSAMGSHHDVPQGTRELTYAHDAEDTRRTQRKRNPPDSWSTIHVCGHGHHNERSLDCSNGLQGEGARLEALGLPAAIPCASTKPAHCKGAFLSTFTSFRWATVLFLGRRAERSSKSFVSVAS